MSKSKTPDGLKTWALSGVGIVVLASEHNARVTELYEALGKALEIMDRYTGCTDGCTCGDGWQHIERHEIAPLRAIHAKVEG